MFTCRWWEAGELFVSLNFLDSLQSGSLGLCVTDTLWKGRVATHHLPRQLHCSQGSGFKHRTSSSGLQHVSKYDGATMMRISSSGADIGAAQECRECGPRYTVSLAGQVTTLLHPPVDVLQATADPICSVSARYKFSTLLWVSSFHIVPARSTFLLHSPNNAGLG